MTGTKLLEIEGTYLLIQIKSMIWNNVKRVLGIGHEGKLARVYAEVEKEGLNRFLKAQESTESGYACALAEMKNGHRTGDWVPYIFPLIHGLGSSMKSVRYELVCKSEVRSFIADPTLYPRLREITQVLLTYREGARADDFMGSHYDALKLKACMTLFDQFVPHDIFSEVLFRYFNGIRSTRTLNQLINGD